MFENRSRGRDLAKKTSYVYIIFAILLAIVAFLLNSDMGAMALAEKRDELKHDHLWNNIIHHFCSGNLSAFN